MEAFLDNPLFLSVAFHPRQADRGSSSVKGAVDGTVRTADGVDIGYRFFPLAEPRSDAPLLLYFHGNAEVWCVELCLYAGKHTRAKYTASLSGSCHAPMCAQLSLSTHIHVFANASHSSDVST
jgi:hypothetical protein